MKKKYALKNRIRFFLFLVLIMVIAVSILLSSTVYGYKDIQYKLVTVKSGDTLWTIARDSGLGSGDIREYIFQIKEANNLDSSNIYAGMQLKLPL